MAVNCIGFTFHRHAKDVRQMYEQKLCNATKLYEKLSKCKRDIDAKEMELLRYMYVRL